MSRAHTSLDFASLYPSCFSYREPEPPRMEILLTDLHRSKINRINDRTKRTMLTKAIEMRDAIAVDTLLKHGAYVHKRDGAGDLPIRIAMQQKDERILRRLIKAGAKFGFAEACSVAADAVALCDLSLLELALSHGGAIPLYKVIGVPGKPDALQFLITAAAYGTWHEYVAGPSAENARQFHYRMMGYSRHSELHTLSLMAALEMPLPVQHCDATMMPHYPVLGNRMIERKRVKLFCRYAAGICIALQSLNLPAPQTMAILDHAVCIAPLTSLHKKWQLVTLVKHFKK